MYSRSNNTQPGGLTAEGKKFVGCLTRTLVILVILAIVAAVFFTRSMWMPLLFPPSQPVVNQPTRIATVVVAKNAVVPTAAPNVSQPTVVVNSPTQSTGKPDLTICFVTFPSYLPVVLIPPMNNPAYNAVLYPLQFTAPDGTQITAGSEPEQVEMMKNGQCDVLFTTLDTLARHPSMGKVAVIVDQSDGADKIVAWKTGQTPDCAGKPIKIFNDLKGCTIAATGDSVSEFQALSFLQVAGLTTKDVNLDTSYSTAADATKAFFAGKAAVAGWVPDIDAAVNTSGTKVLVSSAYLHTIYDTILVSPNATSGKHDLVTAFLADWFTALKNVETDPAVASEVIAAWTYQGYPTNDWSTVKPGTAKDDMATGLEFIAQAGYDHNMIYLAHPELMVNALSFERTVWEWGGSQLETPFDPTTLFDSSYLQALSGRSDLRPAAGVTFVDSRFSPFPPDQAAPTGDQLIQLPTVAEFNCPGFAFQPGNIALDPQSGDYKNFQVCAARLLQLVNQADIQILVTGSAASPDPTVFGNQYTPKYSMDIASQRAIGVMSALINMGFPGNRMATYAVVGPIRQDSAALQQDRWVKIEIKASSSSLR